MLIRVPGMVGSVVNTTTGTLEKEQDVSVSDVGAVGDWSAWLVSLLNVLTIQRGASDRLMPLTGIAIPLITGFDTMSVTALLTPHVLLACKRLTGLDGPCPADRLDSDHKVANDAVSVLAAEASIKTGWVAYLAAEPDPSDGAIRGGNMPGGLTLIGGKVADPIDISNAIQCVRYWQSVVNESAQAILSCGANGVAAEIQPDNMAAFFAAVQHLTTHLDLIKQDAASTTAAVLKDGLGRAKDAAVGLAEDAANMAGDVAARAANEAGKLAGNVAVGFFGQIGEIGIAVIAVVVYLAFYR